MSYCSVKEKLQIKKKIEGFSGFLHLLHVKQCKSLKSAWTQASACVGHLKQDKQSKWIAWERGSWYPIWLWQVWLHKISRPFKRHSCTLTPTVQNQAYSTVHSYSHTNSRVELVQLVGMHSFMTSSIVTVTWSGYSLLSNCFMPELTGNVTWWCSKA